ncbi:MAG TPA: hypothetical protein VL171_10485 [Verrucomicrobiae bacterium]|nr:hypothetical protein [Verrucomicrobiae bacterium]
MAVIFTPFFLGLSVFLFRHRPQAGSSFALYAASAFFCFVAIVTASAFRAAFRNPPWWIVSPEQTRKSTLLLLRKQMVVLTKKRLKLAEKNVKVAEKAVGLAKQIEELEKAEPSAGGNAAPPRASA